MAGLDTSPTVPVWLAEDDLGCIICHGLLAWPTTLPCGHSFCRDCLKGMWEARGKGGAGRGWACPTCRKGGPQSLELQKTKILQDLVDKYSRVVSELGGGSSPARSPDTRPARGPQPPGAQQSVAAQKSITEVDRELTELVGQLVGIAKSLQSERQPPESGPDNELSILDMAFSDGVNLSSTVKLTTSNTTERKIKDILHSLEGIQEKLQKNFTWKKPTEEQVQVELPEAPSLSGLLPVQNHAIPKKASRFTQCTISPTFDRESLSCSLEMSEDCRTVTVSKFLQNYHWNPKRFTHCQVLCSQALSSGQQYWEVDTQHCNHWAVGVASGGMGRNHMLGRTSDSWCIEWNETSELSVWHEIKKTVLDSERPKVVGIWLSFEEGKLAFYSVADQKKHLFECRISVTSPLHPAFWLYGLHPGNALTIRPAKV
ncbi:E3 ubiquitin-protein ligase RNF135 isoform X1 [Erinaceus europaeus]|uniref:E3 ubiquitin-protein ligase RNF135 n=1 Tax=Erinaceus europaeus TaxID=9365 RepID=A0A1S3A8B7_ERIEU|nr:E3 ubiquitin-protein ligase RNF135 isoform X1 [Erinaceus europaeus]